jgi:Tol biopolymer transport system component
MGIHGQAAQISECRQTRDIFDLGFEIDNYKPLFTIYGIGIKMKLKTLLKFSSAFFLSLAALALSAATSTPTKLENGSRGDPGFISNRKQLTFVGPRAGEGYFSKDGQKMVFQSERQKDNPFYQIYLMDLKTGKTDLVSTGLGKTTCAWIHPDLSKVLFASTHLDSGFKDKVIEENKSRTSEQKNKYSWSYDENFDLFLKDLKTGKLKRLTSEKGYDAEGAISPDGKKIIFASNRAAYSEKMSAEDEKIFHQDASYMMDLYLMDIDGKNLKRMTNVKGYDGGPFFSADGKKITFRRFSPNGQSAEIMTMNVDGSDEKQLTKLKAMSWAPYFHPSGDYIIFTTNLLGFSNFELYIVDSEGKKEPVRVSFYDGFDGLPVFSPDGKKISWTRRNNNGESQIYIADWDDQKAREALGLEKKDKNGSPGLAETSSEINAKDAEAWVRYLASTEMQGRKTGSPEEKIYAEKIAEKMKEWGLKPAVGNSFLVPFEFISGVQLGEKNSLSVSFVQGKAAKPEDQKTFQVEKDFIPLSLSKTGDFEEAEVVFAGYGIRAPAGENQPAYDSYQGLDVKNKWVLVFRDIPEGINNQRRIHLNTYSRIQHKVLIARELGAKGLILVNGPNAFSQNLTKIKFEGATSESSIPVIHITNELADALVARTGKNLKAWQDVNDRGEILNGPLNQVKLKLSVDLKSTKSQAYNVIGLLPGLKKAGPGIMIGAHGDHLGRGDQGNSLAKNEERNQIHYGADDNASGVSAILEIAEHLAHLEKKNQLKPAKNIYFSIWSGEELGLLGSTHFLREHPMKLQAYLNLDMVGRLRDQLMVQAAGSAGEWKNYLERLSPLSDLSFSVQDDPFVPTDGMAFYLKQIPSLTFFTGAHGEYHSPRDTAETLNYPGIAKIAQFVENLSLQLLDSKSKLTYQKVESSQRKLEGRSFRIYLGTIPDYTQEGIKGVKISGTSKNSPAEKAGLLENDIILELAGTKIENLYDYVYCLQAMKPGTEVEMKINRQGKALSLKILPTLKE